MNREPLLHLRKNVTIVAFVPDLWNDSWQSRHHILSKLSNHYKVLWVSPPLYIENIFGKGYWKNASSRGLKKITSNLWTYRSLIPADYKVKYGRRGIVPWIFRQYHKYWKIRFIQKVNKILRLMANDEVILYIWRPEYLEYLSKLKRTITCYHIDDEYTFDPTGKMKMSDDEINLIKNSDIVFIHSKTLLKKKGHLNNNTHYIPNGVNYEAYEQVMSKDIPEPEILKDVPIPRIIYIGYIKRHIDLNMLHEIATKRKNWSIVFVGSIRHEHAEIKEEVIALKKLSNTYFLGSVSKK